MNMPYWLLKQLPLFDYICPKCKREVKQKSHKCPYCGENYGVPLRVPPKVLKDQKALEEYVHKHVFPRVSASQREYLTQFFTTIFAHGFEGGNFGTDPNTGYAWTGTSGTPTVTSGDAHHGTYKAQFVANDYCYKDFATEYSTLFTRVYVYIVSDSGTGDLEMYIGFKNTGWAPHLGRLGVTGANRNLRLQYYDEAVGFPILTSSTTLSLGTWYCLELKGVISDTVGEYRVYLDGVEVTDLTVTGFDSNPGAGIDEVIIGQKTSERTQTNYVDCVVVADTYIGPEVPPKPKGSIVVHAKLAGVI
jgi:DNA-directed RNA polymerase subunit RPC12/RpoP